MSDLAPKRYLVPSDAQLSVDTYFSDVRFAQEQTAIFAPGANYVGNERLLSTPGDFQTLTQEQDGRVLVHDAQGIALLSNVCRHRQALMLQGEGNIQNIVCPLHRWTYDLSGKLIGAPMFGETPCLSLKRFPLENWKGLLFAGPRQAAQDLGAIANHPDLDLSDYQLDRRITHECQYNWKTFIEVYCEDYHVQPFHPGLAKFVSCDELEWRFGEWYSWQRVGTFSDLGEAGSPIYQRWHDAVLRFRRGKAPSFGAIWMTYYPNLMIELYPHTLVVSTLYPQSPQRTLNVVEFYYPEEIIHFERDFIEAQQAAYFETVKEDDEIAHRMDAGRAALMRRHENETGPYQSPLEDGMLHFHEWYRAQLK